MKKLALIAALGAATAAAPAAAQLYITDTTTYTGLGDQLGTPFDQVTLNSVVGTYNGSGTYLANTVDFTVGVNANTPDTYTGTFTNTFNFDGSQYSYTVPYTLLIDLADTITLGGNSFSFMGHNIRINPLTLTSSGGTVYGDLTASISVPEPATWALMIVAFGAVGFAMRRRALVRTNVSFA